MGIAHNVDRGCRQTGPGGLLTTRDGIEIRPYTGGFVAMTGDGTPGHPDWPHIGVALMQPRSRGQITLVSPDPEVAPLIEHRYDSEPEDVAALHNGSELPVS